MTEETDTIEELEPVTLEAEPEPEADDAPVVITLGDEPAPEDNDSIDLPEEAPKWAKGLRETAEERRKRIRELERENRELKARAAPVEEELELGKEPDLEDFDYDTDAFKTAWREWDAKAKEVEAKKEAKRKEAEEAEQAWQESVKRYEEGKAKLRVADVDEVVGEFEATFNETQQGILKWAAKDATLLAYAIAKDPAATKELASISDPIKWAWAASKLEDKVKVSTRKPAAKPETVVTSTARGSSSVDNHLERLREEAGRTGDFSKVMAYKRQIRGK